jgi:hypothetical protein
MSLYAVHTALDKAELWYSVYDDATGWGPDTQVPNVGMAESPSPVVYDGQLLVFHQGGYDQLVSAAPGETGLLWYSSHNDTTGSWEADTQVPTQTTLPFGYPGVMTNSPSAVVYGADLYVFYQGAALAEDGQGPGYLPNGELWYSADLSGQGWQPQAQLPNVGMSTSPSAVVYGADLYVFHQGGYENGELFYSAYISGQGWQPDTQLPNVGMSQSPSAVVYGNDLYVFHQGGYQDRQLFYSAYVPGSGWQPDTPVEGVMTAWGSPSAVVRNGELFVFYPTETAAISNGVEFARFDGTNWSTKNPVPTIVPGATIVNGVEVISAGIGGSAPGMVSTG